MRDGYKAQRIVLQARDRRLLSELAQLRAIDREHASRIGRFTSISRANARLLALTEAGFLQRGLVGTIAGGRKAVYTIPGSASFVRGSRTTNEHLPTAALEHQLAVNDLYIAARYPRPGCMIGEVTTWQRFSSALSPKLPLIPDGLMRLKMQQQHYHFFAEVDRGNEPLSVWQKKVALYIHAGASQLLTATLGTPRFGVIVAVDSHRRLSNIRRTVRAQTHRMFWFATLESIKRDGFWSSVWFRPNGEQRQSLL